MPTGGGGGDSRIGPLWGLFPGRRHGRPDESPVAVCDEVEKGDRGAYRILLSGDTPLPGGTIVVVPAGRHAHFSAGGERSAVLTIEA